MKCLRSNWLERMEAHWLSPICINNDIEQEECGQRKNHRGTFSLAWLPVEEARELSQTWDKHYFWFVGEQPGFIRTGDMVEQALGKCPVFATEQLFLITGSG